MRPPSRRTKRGGWVRSTHSRKWNWVAKSPAPADVLLCSEFAMRATRKAWPLLVLLAEVLAVFRHILFYGHYALPRAFRSPADVLLCSEFAMRATRKAWPLLVLLAEVLAFFRHILFYGHYAIPWDF